MPKPVWLTGPLHTDTQTHTEQKQYHSNDDKSRLVSSQPDSARFAKNGRMADLPELRPKYGTSLNLKITVIKVKLKWLFSPVVFLLNEVVAGPECDQVCIVCRRRDRHTTCTPNVSMTELVRQHLKVVGSKMIVVPQHVIMRRPTSTLVSKQICRYVLWQLIDQFRAKNNEQLNGPLHVNRSNRVWPWTMYVKAENMYTGQKCGNHLVYFPWLSRT